jgi:hypothetical protein
LNHTPLESLEGAAPIEVFAGLRRRNTVMHVLKTNETKKPEWTSPETYSEELNKHFVALHHELAHRRQDVDQHQTEAAADRAKKRLQEHGVHEPDYTPGDWVLVRKSRKTAKSEPLWQVATIVKQSNNKHKQLWTVKFASKEPKRRIQADIHADRL